MKSSSVSECQFCQKVTSGKYQPKTYPCCNDCYESGLPLKNPPQSGKNISGKNLSTSKYILSTDKVQEAKFKKFIESEHKLSNSSETNEADWVKAIESLRTTTGGVIGMFTSDDGINKHGICAYRVEDLIPHLVKFFRKQFELAEQKTRQEGDQRYIKGYQDGRKEELQRIVEMIQKQKKSMKNTHWCGFNDGEQNCECYLTALADIQSKLKETNDKQTK